MNSTHAGNHAGNAGDSIFSLGLSGTLFVTNSIFSGNSTGGVGGGIGNTGTATVTNSTLIGNSAFQGGGIISNSGTLTMTNTIVAGNTASNSDPDLSGAFTSGGHNLIGDTTGSTSITNGGNSDIVNNTPRLGTRSSNGGTTQTIPLLTDSPAIGHGDPTVCAATGAGKVNGVDQRGFLRQVSACSIGAFEAAVAVPDPLPGPRPSGPTGGPAPNQLPAPRP